MLILAAFWSISFGMGYMVFSCIDLKYSIGLVDHYNEFTYPVVHCNIIDYIFAFQPKDPVIKYSKKYIFMYIISNSYSLMFSFFLKVYKYMLFFFLNILWELFMYTHDLNLFLHTYYYFSLSHSFDLFYLWLEMIIMGLITILSRGVGPRFRPDQLSDIVWKDLIIYLIGILLVSIFMVMVL